MFVFLNISFIFRRRENFSPARTRSNAILILLDGMPRVILDLARPLGNSVFLGRQVERAFGGDEPCTCESIKIAGLGIPAKTHADRAFSQVI